MVFRVCKHEYMNMGPQLLIFLRHCPTPHLHKYIWGQLFKARLRLTLGYNLSQCFSFYTSVYFETLKMKTLLDPDKMPEEIFLNSQKNCWKNFP